MQMHTDLIAADAAAVQTTVRLVATVTRDQLALPTPCAGWDLAALLTHMTEQHHLFATATSPTPPPTSAVPSADLVSAYAAAADLVLAAFSQDGVLERQCSLPELSDRTFPGRLVIGFHLVDYVVHGWDVARTLRVAYAPDTDAVNAALPIARAVPTGASRLEAGAAFAPALPLPPNADPLTETLLLLGRDPAWTPVTAGRP
jgi:uncharacterized protein (TIGR03086 family)